MVVPFLKYADFMALLKQNGWSVGTDAYFDEFNRVVIQKDGANFPLQIRDTYGYPFVVLTCQSLGIDPPADHLRVYLQYEVLKKRKAQEAEASKNATQPNETPNSDNGGVEPPSSSEHKKSTS